MNIILNKSTIRLAMAMLATFALSYSISISDFNIYQIFCQFTYVSNIAVIIVLFLVGTKQIDEKNILLVLPQIMVTYLVYSLVLSKGISTETMFSIVEHYIVPIYFLMDFFCVVRERPSIFKVVFVILCFIVGYLSFMFSYGAVTGYYPYFFIDLSKYSLEKVSIATAMIITLVFVVLAVIVTIKELQIYIYKKILDRRA